MTGRRPRKTSWQSCVRWPVATPTTAPSPDLVGELSTRSDAFRAWWAAHHVRYHQTGTKRLHHPVVGDLALNYEVMELAADIGLRIAIFTAEPGSRSEQALDLLASWTATADQLPGERIAADDTRHR